MSLSSVGHSMWSEYSLITGREPLKTTPVSLPERLQILMIRYRRNNNSTSIFFVFLMLVTSWFYTVKTPSYRCKYGEVANITYTGMQQCRVHVT